MAELLRKIYKIFRYLVWDDASFTLEDKKQIMRQFNSAIYQAQKDIYDEVTETELSCV